MTIRRRPLRALSKPWELDGDSLVLERQAILQPINGGKFVRDYFFTNPRRVAKILELLVQTEAILSQIRAYLPEKPPLWVHCGAVVRFLPRSRESDHLFPMGDRKIKELNKLLSAYQSFPRMDAVPGVVLRSRTSTNKTLRDSQRREYWIVEELLRDAERGYLYRYKICPECKRWFYTLTDHQRFCGDDCRKRYASHSAEYKTKRREYMKKYRRTQKGFDRASLASARGE